MTSLRSYLYYFLVALWTLVLGVIFSPLYVLGQQRWVYWLSVLWEWGLMVALRHIVGLSYRVTGYEHLAQPPYVLAIKHQSAFETLLLSIHFPNPAIILKKELLAIPLVGGYLRAVGNVAIDRRAGPAAMLTMVKEMRQRLKEKRVLVIFPEGTRAPVGKHKPYQVGAYMMARLGVPFYPVALNTGCFWNKKGLKAGVAEIAILPAMPTDLPKEAFLTELQNRIESKTRLLEQQALAQLRQRK